MSSSVIANKSRHFHESMAKTKPGGALMISAHQRQEFEDLGVVILKNFYSLDDDIRPIQEAIYYVIGCVIKRHGLAIERRPFSQDNFDNGFTELVRTDRSLGGEVYDLVKMIPSFVRLYSSRKHQLLFEAIRDNALTGISLPSQGVRIDLPSEDRLRSLWHQEFLYQPQSLDGIVFWTPLVPITQDVGPLQICPGSHKEGLLKYKKETEDPSRPFAYGITVKDPGKVVERYPPIEGIVNPGDLVIMDFLTLHQSGVNRSDRARWSMQMRCFNFRDATGSKLGWPASITTGTDIQKLFADYIE